jgi:hypothetical protein
MRPIIRRVLVPAVAGLLVAACGAAVSPAPAGTPESSPPAADLTAATEPPATPSPTVLATDGEGPEYVVGVETANLIVDHTVTDAPFGGRYRDGVVRFTLTMNDPRVTGTGTWSVSVDAYDKVLGPEWGPYILEAEGGTWEGSCTGATWRSGDGMVGSCWLTGTGEFEGSTFYLHHIKVPAKSYADVQGIIYPGSPPAQ